MRYRTLGSTGIKVSEIGFGAWGIGGSKNGDVAYGPADSSASIKTLEKAYNSGVTFYDTSDLYGFGYSEKLLGKVFHNDRHNVIIATKGGFTSLSEKEKLSPEEISKSLHTSLKRLQTDYIDLYQLHSPSMDELSVTDGIFTTLDTLKKSGHIRSYGISVRSPDDGLIAVKEYSIQSIQVNFNMLDQRALNNGLFDLCSEYKIGIIARTPLCFGFLSGQYSEETQFHPLDHRNNWPKNQIKRWSDGNGIFTKDINYPKGQTQAQVALRFCLSYPNVSSTIPGMLKETHVIENVAASHMGPLESDILEAFNEIYHNNTFYK
ncbi:MAG: hypothetical protein CL785_02945 [Chloroflexi bacterium]|nr:hypothetical protein [Chloroflexota bacterium]|tara:strand:+ start:489 stop:1448 length:960 start_codon:yes stop_codon:yes gene_type:complete